MRACRDWLEKDDANLEVLILLPNGRQRRGWIAAGKIYLAEIVYSVPLRKSTTKKKK